MLILLYWIFSIYILIYSAHIVIHTLLIKKIKHNMSIENADRFFNISRPDNFAYFMSGLLFILGSFLFWVALDMQILFVYIIAVIFLLASLFAVAIEHGFLVILRVKGPGWYIYQDQEIYVPENTEVVNKLGFFIRPDFSKKYFLIEDERNEKIMRFILTVEILEPEGMSLLEIKTILDKISGEVYTLVKESMLIDNSGSQIAKNLRTYRSPDTRIFVKPRYFTFEYHVVNHFPDDNFGDNDSDPLDSLPPLVGDQITINT